MRCPNNDECEIVFDTEECDSGVGPYLTTWTAYIYNPEKSQHVENCPPLTDEQIEQLEYDRASDLDYDWVEPV